MGHLDLTLLNIFSHLPQLLPTTLALGPSIFQCFASRRIRLGGWVTQAFYPSIPLQSVGGLMGPFGAPQLHFCCGRDGSTDLFRCVWMCLAVFQVQNAKRFHSSSFE